MRILHKEGIGGKNKVIELIAYRVIVNYYRVLVNG